MGLVTSNAQHTQRGASLPHLNFSVAASALRRVVHCVLYTVHSVHQQNRSSHKAKRIAGTQCGAGAGAHLYTLKVTFAVAHLSVWRSAA